MVELFQFLLESIIFSYKINWNYILFLLKVNELKLGLGSPFDSELRHVVFQELVHLDQSFALQRITLDPSIHQ